jgi:predicted phosphodiesterase
MRILILADIHGNWPALQAVLDSEAHIDHVLCLGDLVNYGPQPAECVRWAMQLTPPSRVVQGNHDRAFGLGIAPDCAPENEHLAGAMQSATGILLGQEEKEFLAKLKPLAEFPCAGATWFACHVPARRALDPHYPPAPNPQWPWETDIVLLGPPEMLFIMVGHPEVLLLGHAHVPMQARWMTTNVLNPGSVGCPTDGDPRAAYAIWEDGEFTLGRAAYDCEETIRAYGRLDLEPEVAESLCEGLRTGKRVPVQAMCCVAA